MKRTNTAKWIESAGRWQINVQKDGIRKTFVSSKPGRTGQAEANRKADQWLDDGVTNVKTKVKQAYEQYMDNLKISTSKSHWQQYDSIFRNHINPQIGNVRIENLTEQQKLLDEMDVKSEYVFCRRDGEPLQSKYYYDRWKVYRNFHNMPPVTPYELRHTFVSAVKSLPEGYLKNLVGHSKNMDTYGTYSHEMNGDMQETAVLVQNIFKQILLA